MSERYTIWVQVEVENEEDETYRNVTEPEALRCFSSRDEAVQFLDALILIAGNAGPGAAIWRELPREGASEAPAEPPCKHGVEMDQRCFDCEEDA